MLDQYEVLHVEDDEYCVYNHLNKEIVITGTDKEELEEIAMELNLASLSMMGLL